MTWEPCKVLIVEDDGDAREALAHYLRIFGYFALQSANGFEALELLRSGQRPALILLDLVMPVLDGWGFIREIEADPLLRDIPIAVTTAAHETPPVPPRSAGAFRKPIFLPQLLTLVREHCGESVENRG